MNIVEGGFCPIFHSHLCASSDGDIPKDEYCLELEEKDMGEL
jgi:hypothetical protein